jgi:hypothetical protein
VVVRRAAVVRLAVAVRAGRSKHCRISLTPKAFSHMANAYTSDPRVVAALQPWAEISQRLRRFRTWLTLTLPIPGLSLRSNPGLELVNAFGVLEQEPVLCSMSSWGIERFRRAFAGSS